jgi:hypothetical protein
VCARPSSSTTRSSARCRPGIRSPPKALQAAEPLVEAPTPRAALAEARRQRAPVLLSRHIIAQSDFTEVKVHGLAFPRSFVLVTPAYGESTGEVLELVDGIRGHIRIWLR